MSRKLAGSVGYFPSDVRQTFISLSVDCCSAHSSLCSSIMASPVTVVHSDVSGSGTASSGSGSGDVVISVGWSSGLLDEDIVEVDVSAASLETSVGCTLGFVFEWIIRSAGQLVRNTRNMAMGSLLSLLN